MQVSASPFSTLETMATVRRRKEGAAFVAEMEAITAQSS